MRFEDNLIENLDFGRFGLNSSIFEKLFISYSCILLIIQCALRSFCIKMLYFLKQKTDCSRFSINRTCCSIDQNCDKNFGLTKFFFMHHLRLGFTCIAFFLYPSCSFTIISLIVFTHNMHTLHYIGYLTWSKNCLINFWAMYFLVYVFLMCEL